MTSKILVLFGFVLLATVQSVPINPLLYGMRNFDLDEDLVTKMLKKDIIYGKYGDYDDDVLMRRSLTGKYFDTRFGFGKDFLFKKYFNSKFDLDKNVLYDDLVKTDLMIGRGRDVDLFDYDVRGDVFENTVDRKVIKDLVKLDIVNRPLVKRLLTLDVTGRKIVGDLAREINHIIFKKGKLYPLTLWDRVLKIKGRDTFLTDVNRNIFDKIVETEFEDKEVLKDLMKLDTVDRRLVTSLLFTDVYDREKVADLADVINVLTFKRGRVYPIALLDKVTRINGGFYRRDTDFDDVITRGYGDLKMLY